MKKIQIKGPVIGNAMGEVMSYFGDDNYAYPSKVKRDLEDSGNEDVIVEINSPGGYTSPAAEIYTDLKAYSGTVEVHIVGEADSAASIIAMAGDKVLMSPMGIMMIHRAMSSAEGNTDDFASGKQALDQLDQSIVDAYAEKTGKDKQEIYRLMSQTTWMNAKTAIQEGFADGMMEFNNAKQNQVASPMLNAAVTVPHFDESKMMEFKQLLSQAAKSKEQSVRESENNKDLNQTKQINHKLGLLFGGK